MASLNDHGVGSLDDLIAQLGTISQTLRSNPGLVAADPKARMKLLGAANDVADVVKQPQDYLVDLMPKLAQLPAIRLFIKWKVFSMIPVAGTISYSEIATKLGAEIELIIRLARILVTMGMLKQIGTDQVAHTPHSVMLSSVNPLSAIYCVGFDEHLASICAMPRYFETCGLKEPLGRRNTIFAYANDDVDSTVWEILAKDPERMSNFMLSMDSMSQSWPILGTYDLSWVATRVNESTNRPLVVDVGGGKGHCLKNIVQSTPGLPMARCVLEDLPEVIEAVKQAKEQELDGAELVALDFHSEQPVKGALVYYLRRCLHDYGDADCVDIIRQISDAMADDSKLLIVEQIIGDSTGAMAVAADLFMALIGGKERTLENFEKITGEAGLKVKQVFTNPGSDAAIIECVKA